MGANALRSHYLRIPVEETSPTIAIHSTSTAETGPVMLPASSQILSKSSLVRKGVPLVIFGLFRLVYTWLLSIYRVHCHPLAGFVGPREAANSRDWEHKIATEKSAYSEKVCESLHKKIQ